MLVKIIDRPKLKAKNNRNKFKKYIGLNEYI